LDCSDIFKQNFFWSNQNVPINTHRVKTLQSKKKFTVWFIFKIYFHFHDKVYVFLFREVWYIFPQNGENSADLEPIQWLLNLQLQRHRYNRLERFCKCRRKYFCFQNNIGYSRRCKFL
jgi:hypothetical protein